MLSKGRHPPLLQSIYVPVLVSLLLVYVSSVAAFRSYGRKPVPPHTMHFVKHRREVTALPKTGTATMDEFIEDIWKDLHGKCWGRRPVELIFSEVIDVMHPYCDGTWAEFGVFKGATASMAAAWRSRFCGSVVDPVYGFDTFTGLPGDWHFFKSGDFSLEGQLPDVPDNVELVKGLFNESIPRFREAKTSLPPLSYLHIDCDLYEGSRDALFILNDLIVPGTLLLFDELVNYEKWQEHEIKALWEWATANNRKVHVLGKKCDPASPDGPFNRQPSFPVEFLNANATQEQSVVFVVVQ